MAFPLLGPLIGAGASLLGGALNRKAQRKANEANRPINQVREWEAAGINPIVGITSGAYIPHQAASIGDSFSRAGGAFQRGLEFNHEQELRETELSQENERLKGVLDDLAKPVNPGHIQKYGEVLPLPSVGEIHAPGRKSSSSGTGLSVHDGQSLEHGFGSTGSYVAPGRELEASPYTSGTGLTEINNAFTDALGGPVVVPGDDGEPMGIDELATLGAAGAAAASFRVLNSSLTTIRDNAFFNSEMRRANDRSRRSKYPDKWGKSPPRSVKSTQKEIDSFNYRRSVTGG